MLELGSCLRLWEEPVFASNPRGLRLIASLAWQAVYCIMHRGQPPLDRHQHGDSCGDLWPLPQRPKGADSSASKSICSPSGGAPDRSAPVKVCGQALQARLTVLLAMVGPRNTLAASALPEESHMASCRREKTASFEVLVFIKKVFHYPISIKNCSLYFDLLSILVWEFHPLGFSFSLCAPDAN